jgi:tellurite resistance protein TerC
VISTLATQLIAAGDSDKNFVDFHVPLWAWALLIAVLATLLIADLLLVHRTPHDISLKEAGIESAIWITIGLSFTFVMWGWHGGAAAGEYVSGYLIEKSLSIDNVFVWAVIFSYFGVPKKYQFRVLFWGIFGALVLRAIFIFAGVSLIERFDWILYVFGAFLLITAVRVARHKEGEVHPENNPVLKLVKRFVPSTDEYDGQKMFTIKNGKRLATPLFAVLILVETTDVIFAVDSIPAILSVSHQTFIVFSSNAFAILGLRSLYFLLAGVQGKFRYLNLGLGVILFFVGTKMLLLDVWHMPTWLSLSVIVTILTITILASLWADKKNPQLVDPTEEAALEGARARGEVGPVEDVTDPEH